MKQRIIDFQHSRLFPDDMMYDLVQQTQSNKHAEGSWRVFVDHTFSPLSDREWGRTAGWLLGFLGGTRACGGIASWGQGPVGTP